MSSQLVCAKCNHAISLGDGFLSVEDAVAEDLENLLGVDVNTVLSDLSSRETAQELVGSMLFDLVSERIQSEHPLCTECSDLLMDDLNRKIEQIALENSKYEKGLGEYFASSRKIDLDEITTNTKEILEEEQVLLQELNELEENLSQIHIKNEMLQHCSSKLSDLEEKYWNKFNSLQNSLFKFSDRRNALVGAIHSQAEQIEKLNSSNAFNDCFHIWYDGHFGTINGFRLGRLPSQMVEWNEINAGLGQAALLLSFMASRCIFTFPKVAIMCVGAKSTLFKRSEPGKAYELYHAGDAGWKQPLIGSKRFDAALALYLNCILEFSQFVETQDKHFSLPYMIEKDNGMIGGLSIRYNNNLEIQWTKALKYMLTDLKFLLVWLSKVS